MKLNKTFFFLILACLGVYSLPLTAQIDPIYPHDKPYEPPTDPPFNPVEAYCTQNTPFGYTINAFDWRAEKYTLYIKGENGLNYMDEVSSPFFSTGITSQPNVSHLAFVSGGSQDFQPEDGWELLYLNFGSTNEYVPEPSFGLYNRYSGLMRLFVWLTANEGGIFQTATINLSHIPNAPVLNAQTAVLEHLNTPMHALDSFQKGLNGEALNRYTESNGTWLISEFTAAYDPCVCRESSAFEVLPIAVSVSDIDLEIEGTSIIEPIAVAGTAQTASQNGFSSIIGGVAGAFGTLASIAEKGQKTHKNLQTFSDFAVNELLPIATSPFSSAPVWLADIFSPIPGIGAAITILDMLIGGGKKSSAATTVSSFSAKHKFTASGTATTVGPYAPSVFYVPGSDQTNLPAPNRPIYNNPLGVANLLETPVIDVHVASGGGGGVTLTRKTYTLSQQIKYAINTTGGLAENPKSVVAAIYFKGCPMEAVPAGSNLVGNGLIVAEDDGTWRTPFLPLDCLLDYEVGFQEAIASNIVTNMCEGEVTLKVVMAIERAASVGGGDDIMYMATYYTAQNIIPHPDILTMPLPSNPFGEMDLFEIEEDPSSLGCAFVPPTDPSAFCESKYDPAPLDDGLSEKSLESQIGNLDINMYPNPVNNYLVVVNLEGPVQITITDMTGRTWKQVETADLEYKFNVSELPSGMYTVTIRTQSGLLQGSELLFKE